jgi:hypothetical protein
MVEERIKTYEEEEKALRVIIMEEEGEREKKEKQQRLEQKALLNLSKGERKFEEIKGPFIYLHHSLAIYQLRMLKLGSTHSLQFHSFICIRNFAQKIAA